jgi:predicted transposase YdaD
MQEEKKILDYTSDMNVSFIRGMETGLMKGLKDGMKKGVEKGLKNGIKKGKAEGEQNKAFEIARNSLKSGLSYDLISEITGLSRAQIEALKS